MVLMSNKSNRRWVLKPTVEGDFFYGGDTFIVEPSQSKSYELEYRPQVMTSEGKKHVVSYLACLCL